MLLISYENTLLQSILTERILANPPPAPTSIDQIASDFDGVTFHISTPQSKSQIQVSLQVKCYKELVAYGAEDVLQREYGAYITSPEAGYDFSILIDLESLPSSQEEREELVRRVSLLKRNVMAAPFEKAFAEFDELSEEAAKYTSESAPAGVAEGGEVKAIHYREEEAFYIKASHDRVTVIFSTLFKDEVDRIFGKVFLQEFVDARRRAIQNAPQVLFRSDPPLELQGMRGVGKTGEKGEMGFITFVLFPRHLKKARRAENISHIQTFRDYFHYHIKASKAYIHSRMRRRTADFLQGRWYAFLSPERFLTLLQCSTVRDPRMRSESGRLPAEGLSEYKGRSACSASRALSVTHFHRLIYIRFRFKVTGGSYAGAAFGLDLATTSNKEARFQTYAPQGRACLTDCRLKCPPLVPTARASLM
jgi:actin related protein 2/3 complex, subunit 2